MSNLIVLHPRSCNRPTCSPSHRQSPTHQIYVQLVLCTHKHIALLIYRSSPCHRQSPTHQMSNLCYTLTHLFKRPIRSQTVTDPHDTSNMLYTHIHIINQAQSTDIHPCQMIYPVCATHSHSPNRFDPSYRQVHPPTRYYICTPTHQVHCTSNLFYTHAHVINLALI